MTTIIMGIITIALVLAGTIFHNEDIRLYINPEAILIVVVGGFGVFLLSTPNDTLRFLLDVIRGKGAVGRVRTCPTSEAHRDILALTRSRGSQLPEQTHPLIRYAQELWDQGVDEISFETHLEQRLEELNQTGMQAVTAVRNLAKYPPSLGMMGTVIGLVGLFSGLTPDQRSTLGPKLAIAMTSTFYGLILANLVIMPLADRMNTAYLASARLNEHIFQVLLLIHQREVQPIVEEKMKSYAA